MLNDIKEHLDIKSDAEFSRFLEIKANVLHNWRSRNTFNTELLYTKCRDLNPDWLLTGEGKMIKSNSSYLLNESASFVKENSVAYNKKEQLIPLYNLEATAGLVPLFDEMNGNNVEDYIHIPNMPKCDGAIHVTGDSMYPLIKSGDIITFKKITVNSEFIFWGEMYLISVNMDDDEYITIKFIQKSDIGSDYVKLVSHNQHHQPKDINIKHIRALALVKASIRFNSMQ